MVRELVAVDMPASERFVETIQSIWDSNDAIFPIDQRLPEVARKNIVKQMNATSVIAADGSRTKLEDGLPVESGDALVIATSGSTGSPKGVVHTHDSIRAAISATGLRLACNSSDHWLACISLAHVGGLSVVLRALHFRSHLTIGLRADRPTIEDALDRGATMTSLVPTVLQSVDITRFKTVLIGGAKPPNVLPANAISTYGLSETMGGVVYDGLPLAGVEVRIGENSEIEIRAECLLRCYRDGVDPKSHDGWLKTGDTGEMSGDRLEVLGRNDDLINTGGYKVWPNSVENSIRQMEAVADVVVASQPDQKWGSAVTAWVVLKDDTSKLNLEQLRRHVRLTLPDYYAPRHLLVVRQIPRSSLGKVLMAELKSVTPQYRESRP